jgi:hypothetical protein
MKKILVVGDSFTFGQGCSDRLFYYDPVANKKVGDHSLVFQGPSKNCFASLLQKDYPDYKVLNVSTPGADNTYITSTVFKYISEGIDLVLYNGTGQSRIQIAHPVHKLVPMSWVIGSPLPDDFPKPFVDATEAYSKYLYNEMALLNISACSIMAAYGIAQRAGAKFIWSTQDLTFSQKIEKVLSAIEEYRIKSIVHTLFEGPEDDRSPILKFHSEDHHANDLGHKNYYENHLLPKVKEIG